MAKNKERMTEQELMARLKFSVGIALAVTLVGIVFVVLYSIIFVTQPLDAMSPIDQKFFELIIPIATFLTGTLSGIMLGSTSSEDKPKESEPADHDDDFNPNA
jgi:ABC-type spermidine/putrescine transport system permease subunit II